MWYYRDASIRQPRLLEFTPKGEVIERFPPPVGHWTGFGTTVQFEFCRSIPAIMSYKCSGRILSDRMSGNIKSSLGGRPERWVAIRVLKRAHSEQQVVDSLIKLSESYLAEPGFKRREILHKLNCATLLSIKICTSNQVERYAEIYKSVAPIPDMITLQEIEGGFAGLIELLDAEMRKYDPKDIHSRFAVRSCSIGVSLQLDSGDSLTSSSLDNPPCVLLFRGIGSFWLVR